MAYQRLLVASSGFCQTLADGPQEEFNGLVMFCKLQFLRRHWNRIVHIVSAMVWTLLSNRNNLFIKLRDASIKTLPADAFRQNNGLVV